MPGNSPRIAGRHFLQIPGPSPVPGRIERAIARPVIDHRGPEFAGIGKRALEGMQRVFKCSGPVFIFPSSGTGAWEAALVNTLSPGDRILMVETGHFASLWKEMAERLGLAPEVIPSDWRTGADPAAVEARLRLDTDRTIKAVCIVHNETSTGCVSPIPEIRRAIDAADHPALLIVDTVSSLACMEYDHDAWNVDVTVSGSQKGMMLPPGIAFNAASPRALAASQRNGFRRSYWSWQAMLDSNARGYFPYTPATTLLYGLVEAIDMLEEEGLGNVFARHARHAEATRRAVAGWGLELLCREPNDCSSSLTAIFVPPGHDADHLRHVALEHFDISLGTGLGRLAGKVFRFGHLGDTNDLTILGALAGIEMSLEIAEVAHRKGGVAAAMAYLGESARMARSSSAR